MGIALGGSRVGWKELYMGFGGFLRPFLGIMFGVRRVLLRRPGFSRGRLGLPGLSRFCCILR